MAPAGNGHGPLSKVGPTISSGAAAVVLAPASSNPAASNNARAPVITRNMAENLGVSGYFPEIPGGDGHAQRARHPQEFPAFLPLHRMDCTTPELPKLTKQGLWHRHSPCSRGKNQSGVLVHLP